MVVMADTKLQNTISSHYLWDKTEQNIYIFDHPPSNRALDNPLHILFMAQFESRNFLKCSQKCCENLKLHIVILFHE
jgi:hypothetical protein